MPKITVPIRGMHCRSCEIIIEKGLKKLREVRDVRVSYKDGIAHIHCRGGAPSMEAIENAIKEAGYEVGEKERLPWFSRNSKDYVDLFWAAAILGALYYAARGLGIFNLNVDTSDMGFLVVLLVGLVAGVSTCMALVGGLVLALSARHSELHPEATAVQNFRPHLYFNFGRVGGYALFGGSIGLIGSAITPSATSLGIMTIAVGAVMIFLGLKLIEIFPALRDKSIALPKFISKALGLHRENREYSHKGAIVTGALTFFLPCGFTQAMQLYAVSTGSFWQGALVMALFALGTAPGLIGIGYLSSVFKGKKARLFFMVAGIAVILLGLYNVQNGRRLMGKIVPSAVTTNTVDVASDEFQEVRMTEDYDGYSPSTFTVEKGRPVKWIIDAKNIYTCASQIVMPDMGIQQTLQPGENVIFFTPTTAGTLDFSCSMGMYRGRFNVTDGKSATTGIGAAVNLASVSNAFTPISSASAPSLSRGPSCGAGGGGCGCGGGARVATPQPDIDPTLDLSKAQVLQSEYSQSYDIIPHEFTVKKGTPVKWVISMKEPPTGCMRNVVISTLGISQPMADSGETTIVFVPKDVGDLDVTCSMGIYRGTIHVS